MVIFKGEKRTGLKKYKVRLIKLAVGSIVYSCIFLKEIIADGSFHILEHCQHDLLYWPLHLKLSSPKKSVSS